jgi:ADP-heptose:LPS heptosyltransferase
MLEVVIFLTTKSSGKKITPPYSSETPIKVLMMGYGGLGDMIFLLPTIGAIKSQYPRSTITLLCGSYSAAPELIDADNQINEIKKVDWVQMDGYQRKNVCQTLKNEKYDVLVASYTNPIRFYLPAFSNIPTRIGHLRKTSPHWSWLQIVPRIKHWFRIHIWEEEFYRCLVFNRPIEIDIEKTTDHDIQKHLNMARSLGIPREKWDLHPHIQIPSSSKDIAERTFHDLKLNPNERVMGLNLGVSGGMEWKIWDIKRWGALLDRLLEKHPHQLLLFGSAHDEHLEKQLGKTLHVPIKSLLGQTSVLEMAYLIKKCHIFLSNDSGPSKLAMAMGVPTAIIWGPSDRLGAGAWEDDQHAMICNKIICSPCFSVGLTRTGHGVLNHTNCGHHKCLNELSVDFAFQQISHLIQKYAK